LKVDFRNKRLIELYSEGTSKKYKISKQVLRKFFIGIRALESADTIHDLWKTPSLKFEKLEGFANRYSIRLTREWRLEMEIDWEDEEKTRGTIFLVEISKHYGD
jgi:plasmid maintenance system killer protein